jgi:hypothetical protein
MYSRYAAFSRGVAALIVFALTGCADQPPFGPTVGATDTALSLRVDGDGPSRRDTPWRRMSNAELIAKVTEAGGRVFVGFKNPDAAQGVDERGRVLAASNAVSLGKASLRSMGAQVELEFKKTPVVVASMSPAMVAALRRSPYVEYVEPIFPGEYLSQDTTWNVKRVNAPAAWINNSDGSGAILLMLDSGIPASHTDLSPTFTGACDGSNGIDTFGHGSAVAGIIAASDNSTQIIGVSPGVSLWSIRIGAMGPDPAAAACGVDTGRDFGVDVITLSFTLSSTYTALTDEINGAYYQDDIVVVAAAGNDNGGAVTYPATLAAAIAVSATDSANSIASFSSVGSKVEIAAPGTTVDGSTGLTSTCLSGSTCDCQRATHGGNVLCRAARCGCSRDPRDIKLLVVGSGNPAPSRCRGD